MLRSWHRVVRAAVRTQRTRHALPRPSVQEVSRALPVTQFRSFSAQTASHSTAEPPVNNVIAFSTRDASLPPSNRKSRQSSVNLSRRVSERVLAAPESSYGEALRAFEYLRDTRSRLKERHYLALMEKASVEQQYHAIRTHFTQFCDALNANQIEVYRGSKFTWESYASERLQIHRHVLWAMLQTGLPTTRFRAMQRHFRKHELATMRNRLELYESDALNFLLRMECTFQFVDPLARDQGRETWITRVVAILDAMRSLRYRTNYSSSHALFHFLMHRPDVALSGNKESEHKDEASQEDNAEDQAIYDMLTSLLDEYPHTLERDPRRLSLAVSTAASAGRLWLAVRILRDADARGIAVDSASFAHVVAMAKDDDTRLAIADLYTRAKEHDRLYDNEDNHSMKKYLLQYAIHDGNFTQIMELLHEMEYSKIQAPPRIVAMLFASIAKYRAQIRHKLREKDPRTIETALNECPSVLQLMKSFPHVIDRNTHTGSHGVLLALRSGDVDVALTVLRTTVQHTKVPLRPEVFSQALYAVLVSDANQRDVLAAHEVEQLYDARFPNQRDVLNAQLLHLCASNNDLGTMVAVLNHWHDHAPVPLSKRTRQRVFDVISSHLKAIRKQDKDESESDEGDARYKLGGLELSFRGVLEKYPMLVPLDTATINTALMRSATAGLVDDVATLLSVAHTKDLAIETVVYKAALDVLHKAAMEKNATADVALRTTIETMEANGSWARVREQFPEFVASIELEVSVGRVVAESDSAHRFQQNGGDGSLTIFAPIIAWIWKEDDTETVERVPQAQYPPCLNNHTTRYDARIIQYIVTAGCFKPEHEISGTMREGFGGAVAMSTDAEHDAATDQLQEEWERVRRQRKALEKQQKQARSDVQTDAVESAIPDEDGEDAALVALQAQPTTDPFACCCRPFKFKKLGQSYILSERRVIERGRVSRHVILVGPHWVGVLVTLSIIVCCTGLFLHQQCAHLPWYYSLMTLGFCGLTLYYLYGVACKDPGIVQLATATKIKPKQDDKTPETENLQTTVTVDDDDVEDGDADGDDLEAGGARVRRGPTAQEHWRPPASYQGRFSPRARFCDICEVAQDAYTEHCDDCGVCIEEYDHHCPWMGKCIGKKNMHAFKMFNVAWVLYVIFVLFVSIQNVDWGDVAVQRLHRLSTGEWVPMGTTQAPH